MIRAGATRTVYAVRRTFQSGYPVCEGDEWRNGRKLIRTDIV